VTSFHFVRTSGNRKTGPIPVTMTTRDSCPASCTFKGAGCYAEHGPIAWQWSALDHGRNALDLDRLCAHIRTLPGNQLWRHNVAGDLPGPGESIDPATLAAIARANRGRRGFTYTHKHTTPANIDAIRSAQGYGFTINLSANNGTHADTLGNHGLPVVVVIPATAPKVSFTPSGRKIVQCPAENSARITCANCGLCQLADRPYLIGFKPKGIRRRHVNKLATEETTT
jgi:hypothetical protein